MYKLKCLLIEQIKATYLLWKFNILIEKAKTNAKSTANPATAAATTPRNSCLKPKYVLINSSTVSPDSSLFCRSPNCDVANPYKLQAIGHAQ